MAVNEWQQLALNGNVVAAIKCYRATMSVGLADAISAVEDWVSQNIPTHPRLSLALRLCERATEVIGDVVKNQNEPFDFIVRYVLGPCGEFRSVCGIHAAVVSTDSVVKCVGVLVRSDSTHRRIFDEIFAEIDSGDAALYCVISIDDPSVVTYTRPQRGLKYHLGTIVELEPVISNCGFEVSKLYDGLGIGSI
jgi:hypothetical protein